MAKRARKRAHSAETRAQMSVSQLKRRARDRSRTAAASRDEVKRTGRKSRSPHGIRILTRNGKGKDIIQADADEVILAVRAMKELRKLL